MGAQRSDPEQYASRGGNASLRWILFREAQLTVLQQARLGGFSAGNTGKRPNKSGRNVPKRATSSWGRPLGEMEPAFLPDGEVCPRDQKLSDPASQSLIKPRSRKDGSQIPSGVRWLHCSMTDRMRASSQPSDAHSNRHYDKQADRFVKKCYAAGGSAGTVAASCRADDWDAANAATAY